MNKSLNLYFHLNHTFVKLTTIKGYIVHIMAVPLNIIF